MAKAKKQSLAEIRGIYDSRESNSIAVVLVAASVDATSKALADELKSERRECDIYGKKSKISGSAYFPFQLRGHIWTTIVSGYDPEVFDTSLAKRLSARLKTKAIGYVFEDTSCSTTCQLFDGGELVEVIHHDFESEAAKAKMLTPAEFAQLAKKGFRDGFYFFSKIRPLKAGAITQDSLDDAIADFFRGQDALLFFLTSEKGGAFTLEAGSAADVLRADMVLANAKQKTAKKKEMDDILKQFPWNQ
jgi:hypothetical protein